MLGTLYDRALDGEHCWLRQEGGERQRLPVHNWLGGHDADSEFDTAIIGLCEGRTIDLGCGPGRLVAHLIQRGFEALGVDQSPTAIRLAHAIGAPAMHADMFGPLPHTGRWQTVLLADGNIGVDGDPSRVLSRAAELLTRGGRCVVELDPDVSGVRVDRVRLESETAVGPWFRWASVGVDCAATLAERAGMTMVGIHHIGERVVATLARS